MGRKLLLTLIAIACLAWKSSGQIGVIADRAYVLDTLRTHSRSTGISFLFYISDDETNDHTDFRFINSAHFNYVFTRTDFELSLRQLLERKDDGEKVSNHLVFLGTGIRKFDPIDDRTAVMRKIYPEAIAIYQDNSDRGLRRRFQTGALLHPWARFKRKYNFNVGIGFVYDWSSWEVNDKSEIDDASPELREKIEFVNSRVTLRKDMYQDHNEFRPIVYIVANYRVTDLVTVKLSTLYQQSLKSPYSKEITDEYPDLGKVYPYVLGQLDLNVKLFKGLAMSVSSAVDYENNNLSLYKSSWSYSTLIGFSWVFTNQDPRMYLRR